MSNSNTPGFGTGGMIGGGPHSDVLCAKPDSKESTLRLIEELKSRGRGAVQTRNYPDAEQLYGKGIDIIAPYLDDDDENLKKEVSILNSNRSLSRLQQGKISEAILDAEEAVRLNPSYVKAYWRLGQALDASSQTKEALEAYEKALGLESGNKALKKEVEKLKVKLEQERLLLLGEKFDGGTAKETKTRQTKKRSTKKKSSPSSSTAEEKKSSSTEDDIITDDANKEFTKSDHVRGYKVVGGKKTSYFHHEQTEEEKRLIGDIAPKKIDSPNSQNATNSAPVVEGTSAWNKAGTWEEKDVTKWAIDTLKASLLSVEYVLPDGSPVPNAKVCVTQVKGLENGGHASYAAVRGKKKYIYEFSTTIHWSAEFDDDEFVGTMTFPDIDGTSSLGDGYDLSNFTVDKTGGEGSDAGIREVIHRFVRDAGLRDALHGAIDDWVRLFRVSY